MPKLRVHNLSISLDGYVAGPDQGVDNPLGRGGPRLHEWAFATRTFHQMQGIDGGDEGLDDQFGRPKLVATGQTDVSKPQGA
jgi:hypothetical protein